MPRLSIIVPHRLDDERLEATLLSVLENRPRDCELIVSHDGSYPDPYQLSDEVIYVQAEQGASLTELLNAGLMAACSPVVCTLLDGVLVAQNWTESALKHFARPEVSCVAPQVKLAGKSAFGLQEKALPNIAKLRSGRIHATQAGDCAAPSLSCGFYRRKPLLALGGWCEDLGAEVADIEMALILREQAQVCVCEPECKLTSQESLVRKMSKEASYELAGVASAYGLVAAGPFTAVSGLLSGMLTGNLSSAMAWASGLLSSNNSEHIAARRKIALEHFASREDSASVKIFNHTKSAPAIEPAQRAARRSAA